jgi:two-component system response regulator CssR
MEAYKVSLVEDEDHLADVLRAYMEKEGWSVSVYNDGESALAHLDERFHLWVLDIMLPGVDGYQVLKKIKENWDTPVIFISARDQDLDRIVGLELGSDDYIAKPFMPRELVIRAKKLLQRVYENQADSAKTHEISGYKINALEREILFEGKEIDLTTKETDVVLFLVRNIGQTKTRTEILTQVWGEDYFGSERAVDDVIRRVRKKMPRLNLETLYGDGYRVI